MADPGAVSAAAAEVSFTSGLTAYVLAGPLGDHFAIGAVYSDGAPITYRASDDSGQSEIGTGVYNASANSLSRDTILFSSTGTKIAWPPSGQRIIRPLLAVGGGLVPPFCYNALADATDNQVLNWDGAEWCPGQDVWGSDAPGGSGADGLSASLKGGAGDGVGAGGAISTFAGAGGASGAGGNFTGGGGQGNDGSAGGFLDLRGGIAVGGGGGGHVAIASGAGDQAGTINITCGLTTTVDGSSLTIEAGTTNGNGSTGGNLALNSGSCEGTDGTGGDVVISAGGGAHGSTTGGAVRIEAATGVTAGYISLTAGDGTASQGGDVEFHLSAGGSGRVGGLLIEGSAIGSTPSGSAGGTGRSYLIFVDPADQKLKVLGDSGTVTTLAVP